MEGEIVIYLGNPGLEYFPLGHILLGPGAGAPRASSTLEGTSKAEVHQIQANPRQPSVGHVCGSKIRLREGPLSQLC